MNREQMRNLKNNLKCEFSSSKALMQEDVTYLKQAKLLYTISSGGYLNLEEFYDSEDSKVNAFLRKVLSKLNLTSSFEMKTEDIQDFFYSMARYARSGRGEEYKRQDELVSNGIKNTEYLEKLGIEIKENQFVIHENTKEEIQKYEDVKQFVKKELKMKALFHIVY